MAVWLTGTSDPSQTRRGPRGAVPRQRKAQRGPVWAPLRPPWPGRPHSQRPRGPPGPDGRRHPGCTPGRSAEVGGCQLPARPTAGQSGFPGFRSERPRAPACPLSRAASWQTCVRGRESDTPHAQSVPEASPLLGGPSEGSPPPDTGPPTPTRKLQGTGGGSRGARVPPMAPGLPLPSPPGPHLMMALPPLRPRACSVVLCKAALPATCREGTGQVCPGHPPGPSRPGPRVPQLAPRGRGRQGTGLVSHIWSAR